MSERFKVVNSQVFIEKYQNIQMSNVYSESNLIKGNLRYTGFPNKKEGGGSLSILHNQKCCKLDNYYKITGHLGDVQDFDFSPFALDIVATGSDDRNIRFFKIPEEFDQDLVKPELTLQGHQKKVSLLQFNPVALNIISSVSQDYSCKVWDIEKQCVFIDFNLTHQVGSPYSLSWNYDGSLISSIWKDKNLRFIDPRQNDIPLIMQTHQGFKTQKFSFLGQSSYFVTTGFSNNYEKELCLWDIKQPNKAVQKIKIEDQTNSAPTFLFYDTSLNLIYLYGLNQNVNIYQFDQFNFHFQYEFINNAKTQNYGFFPKMNVDIQNCEIQRFCYIYDDILEYAAIKFPSDSEELMKDIYPDCNGSTPALQNLEWIQGQNSAPKQAKLLVKYGELSFAQKSIIENLCEVVDFQLFEQQTDFEAEQQKIQEQLEKEKQKRLKEIEGQKYDLRIYDELSFENDKNKKYIEELKNQLKRKNNQIREQRNLLQQQNQIIQITANQGKDGLIKELQDIIKQKEEYILKMEMQLQVSDILKNVQFKKIAQTTGENNIVTYKEQKESDQEQLIQEQTIQQNVENQVSETQNAENQN